MDGADRRAWRSAPDVTGSVWDQIRSATALVSGLDLVEGGVGKIDVFRVHLLLAHPQALANTINMKWILERAANSFFDDIFKDAQYLCACLKVPLLSPYSPNYWAMRLFFCGFGSLSVSQRVTNCKPISDTIIMSA